MLKVVYSNKPEALVAQFQAHLEARVGLPPRDLFTPVRLIVASRPLETWLKHQLVHRAGIVANFETWLLRRFSMELVHRAFPERSVLDGQVMRDLLLAQFLDGHLSGSALGPVRSYLGPSGGAGSELRHLQLAAQLGHLFEEYAFSRRAMLTAWGKGKSSPADGGGELASWQRQLWQQLLKAAEPDLVLPTRLLEVKPEKLITPGEPLFVFGLSFLGTSYHELLVHLAQATDVFLFTLTPCMEFWEDVQSVRDPGRRFVHRAEALTPEALAKEDPFELRSDECRPLALWGRPGREAVRLLTQATGGKSEGVFIDPSRQHPSLLRRLQADMLSRKPTTRLAAPAVGTPFDGVEVAPAPSLRRECEFVAGRIWALLHSETEPLRLDDVAVLIAPHDAESYVAPLLTAFRENHDLPWQLVGLPFALTSPVVEAALLLLELPLSRFTRADVLRVLTHPMVAGRFPHADVDAWVRWVDGLGIVHGERHADHAGTYVDRDALNWDQGLKRVALGSFLATRADNDERLLELGGEQYLPDPSGRHLEEGAGSLLLLARSLLADARALRNARLSVREWAESFATLLSTYLVPVEDTDRRALDACLRTVRALATTALGDRLLPFVLAKELVKTELAGAGTSSGGAVTGGVRVSTLQASRGIPARVTFIVGLSEGSFPASDRAEALDLRPLHPMAGDASGREKDEYLFLEALLCTRDRLVLSYLGRDERTGERRSPSPVIGELLRLLDEGYLGRAVDDPSPHPLVHPVPLWRADAAQAHDPLIAPSMSGLAERRLRALGDSMRALSGPTEPGTTAREVTSELQPAVRAELDQVLRVLPPPELEIPTEDQVRRVSLSQLRAFLECPLQGSARARLHLGDDDDDDLLEKTDEVFNSSALTTVALLRRVFVHAWRAAGGQAFPAADQALEDSWGLCSEQLVAQGRLPLGIFLEEEKGAALEVLQSWRESLVELQPGKERPLQVVRFGPAEEHERIEQVHDALQFELEVPGAPGRKMRVELMGATQPLVGMDCSLLLIRRKQQGKALEKHAKECLRPWLDHLVLTASGVRKPQVHQIGLAYRDGLALVELAALSAESARAYLQALLQDLLLGNNEVLVPFTAVVEKAMKASLAKFPALVRAQMSGTNPACHGPVRRAETFRIPEEAEAGELIARRFQPLFTRLRFTAKGAPS